MPNFPSIYLELQELWKRIRGLDEVSQQINEQLTDTTEKLSCISHIDSPSAATIVSCDLIVSASLNNGLNCSVSGEYSHVEGNQTSATGDYSHAEGYLTTASGDYSHAEGVWSSLYDDVFTIASGEGSHAEGSGCHAEGSHSHAEGLRTLAHYDGCHTEGSGTIAGKGNSGFDSRAYAHAEGGGTRASGIYSHAEGYYTYTDPAADAAHAEGCFTTASANYQHVQGKYNATSSTALMIVGNGSGPELENRSNIIEVETGSVYIGGELQLKSGSGIKFGTSYNLVVTSTTLEDYEEGTWTPLTSSGLTGVSQTSGSYVKIGSLVHITGLLKTSTAITASIGNYIKGFPYNPNNKSLDSSPVLFTNHNKSSRTDIVNGYLYGELVLTTWEDRLYIPAFTSTDDIKFSCTYKTS